MLNENVRGAVLKVKNRNYTRKPLGRYDSRPPTRWELESTWFTVVPNEDRDAMGKSDAPVFGGLSGSDLL